MINIKLCCCKLQSQELALQNYGFINNIVYDNLIKNIKSENIYGDIGNLVLLLKGDKNIDKDDIALNTCQREFTKIQLKEIITINILDKKNKNDIIHFFPIDNIEIEINLFIKLDKIIEINDEDFEEQFKLYFLNHIFTVGQIIAFNYNNILFKCTVKSLQVMNIQEIKQMINKNFRGLIYTNTQFMFISINQKLYIQSKKVLKKNILKNDFNFQKLGIGALNEEFKTIFRRTFASRIYPNYIIKQLGIKHVKGIILYGPPGTGKTLIARQIGKTLNAREPKIVNGPEILNKYVGQSEENVRNLFKEAELEYKENGDNSLLHIIILDEIDAICRERGRSSSSSNVNDSIVNQLLSKIDGVNALNNILLIGMTNRIDLIDEALLRPGRFELHIEISLPNKNGRVEILNIHTKNMKDNQKLHDDVDINELAEQTPNYSGAELEGLVRNAVSYAFERHINFNDLTKPVNADELIISRKDFLKALKETKAAFGSEDDLINNYLCNGIINYGDEYNHIEKTCKLLIKQLLENDNTNLMSILLYGENGTGKTAIAAYLAKEANFYFKKFITAENLIGFSEIAKINYINKIFEDGYKTPLSLIILDNIERLIDYTPIGPRFNNSILQSLMVLIKKKPKKENQKMLIICTTSEYIFMKDAGLVKNFYVNIEIPLLNTKKSIEHILKKRNNDYNDFPIEEINKVLSSNKIKAISIKHLLMIIDMSSQAANKYITSDIFLNSLQDIGISLEEEIF